MVPGQGYGGSIPLLAGYYACNNHPSIWLVHKPQISALLFGPGTLVQCWDESTRR